MSNSAFLELLQVQMLKMTYGAFKVDQTVSYKVN